MSADNHGTFPPGPRINHAPRAEEGKLQEEICLPHAAIEYDINSGYYHWEVTCANPGLHVTGCSRKKRKAIKQARKALERQYLDFCMTLAKAEGLEFTE
jgi:hypothetical protein